MPKRWVTNLSVAMSSGVTNRSLKRGLLDCMSARMALRSCADLFELKRSAGICLAFSPSTWFSIRAAAETILVGLKQFEKNYHSKLRRQPCR